MREYGDGHTSLVAESKLSAYVNKGGLVLTRRGIELTEAKNHTSNTHPQTDGWTELGIRGSKREIGLWSHGGKGVARDSLRPGD